MAELTVQNIDKSGAALSFVAAAAAGDTFIADGKTFLEVINSDVDSMIVTIPAVTDPINTPEAGSLVVPDIAVTVGVGETRKILPPPTHINKGVCSVTYDDETAVTVAAFYVGQE